MMSFSSLLQKWQGAVMGRFGEAGGPKCYVLAQFPYPSGSLHMGHVRVYTVADCYARYKRLRGYDVLHPLGWDAFGLPAENAARQRGLDPAAWTRSNIGQMRSQLQALAIDIDWPRHEIDTSTQAYYRWTQWLFAQMFKAGLAYRREADVHWDPVDQTVLADEQISPTGHAWRSGALVEKRSLPQWFLRITAYKQELFDGLDHLPEWPDSIKEMQRNWINGMRDWLISRQRAWGAPIPIAHCPSCGPVLTIDDAGISTIKQENVCPQCGSEHATPERDTMDTFVDSSWYFLRFADAHNERAIFDVANVQRWLPVDMYVGGIEHAIMHLLYARFVHKFLMGRVGLATSKPEPFTRLLCQGLVLGRTFRDPNTHTYLKPDEYALDHNLNAVIKSTGLVATVGWEKMSKSKFNGVDPTDLLAAYGPDALRLAILFAAPVEHGLMWDEQQFMVGVSRWMRRLLEQADRAAKIGDTKNPQADNLVMRYGRRITKDLDRCHFHTAIANLMTLSNELQRHDAFNQSSLIAFAQMLSPFAPSLAAELASRVTSSVSLLAMWPLMASDDGLDSRGRYSVRLDGRFLGHVDKSFEELALVEAFNIPPGSQCHVIPDKLIISFSTRPTKSLV